MMSLRGKMFSFFPVAANKVKLVESGCLDVILPLLSTQSPFVQFKVLGTLRMLLTGQGRIAVSEALKSARHFANVLLMSNLVARDTQCHFVMLRYS